MDGRYWFRVFYLPTNDAMSSEKTEQPTPKKIQDARKRGEVAKSNDVTATVNFIVLLVALALTGELLVERFRQYFVDSFQGIGQLGTSGMFVFITTESALRTLVVLTFPPLLLTFVVSALSKHLQVRGIFSLEPIKPKAERINPGVNIKNLFSTRNLFNAAKTLVKVMVTGAIVYYAIKHSVPAAANLASATPREILIVMGASVKFMCLACIALYVFMAGVDYGHEYYEYIKQQKMTIDEVRREFKEMEGDPLIKWQRRSIHRELAEDTVLKLVRKANVLITNPTHLAIALQMDTETGGLPRVIAKGSDALAKRMKDAAQQFSVPVVEDRSLARRLFKEVPTNAFVGAEFFAELATVFARLAMSRPASDKPVHRV